MKLEFFPRDFGKILKYQISRKSVQWERSYFIRTDGRTDTTKLILVVAFRNFAKATRNLTNKHLGVIVLVLVLKHFRRIPTPLELPLTCVWPLRMNRRVQIQKPIRIFSNRGLNVSARYCQSSLTLENLVVV